METPFVRLAGFAIPTATSFVLCFVLFHCDNGLWSLTKEHGFYGFFKFLFSCCILGAVVALVGIFASAIFMYTTRSAGITLLGHLVEWPAIWATILVGLPIAYLIIYCLVFGSYEALQKGRVQ